jgi:hypothetical protein
MIGLLAWLLHTRPCEPCWLTSEGGTDSPHTRHSLGLLLGACTWLCPCRDPVAVQQWQQWQQWQQTAIRPCLHWSSQKDTRLLSPGPCVHSS